VTTGGDGYVKDSGSVYPLHDIAAAFYVVRRVDTPDGSGGNYGVTYNYVGAKMDLSGRGLTGFRQVLTTDLQTSIVQTATYRQDFPFVGLTASTVKALGSAALDQVVNSYQFSNASGAATVDIGSAPYRVSLWQSVTTSNDLDGMPLPTVTRTYQYDTYGNATNVVAATSDGFSQSTINTYVNDVANWYLGRLTRASVTNQAP
jgi:hypothetical protein